MKIKRLLEDCLQSLLEPIRTRRAEFIADKGELTRILQHGTRRAHQVSQQTLQQVKTALGLDFFTRREANAGRHASRPGHKTIIPLS
ncbi:hypothetical protein M8494_18680 [Serratia ureilytica]